MTYLVLLAAYLIAFFVIAWASRRSMAVPALALTAGAVLAKMWTDSLTPLIASTGVIVIRPPLSSLVAVALTLLPALLVMARSHRVAQRHHGIVSSLVFAVLAVMLTYGAFVNAVVLDDGSQVFVTQLLAYDKIIITVAIVMALGEVLFYKKPHARDEHKK